MNYYLRLHRLANKLRAFFGRSPQPKRCCRDATRRLPVSTQETNFGRVTTTRCSLCGCKHHEMEAHPGAFSVTPSA